MSDDGDSDVEMDDGIEEGEIKKMPSPAQKTVASETSLR